MRQTKTTKHSIKKVKTDGSKPLTVSDFSITANVVWDANAIKVLQTVADTCKDITQLFVSQKFEITGMSVNSSDESPHTIVKNGFLSNLNTAFQSDKK